MTTVQPPSQVMSQITSEGTSEVMAAASTGAPSAGPVGGVLDVAPGVERLAGVLAVLVVVGILLQALFAGGFVRSFYGATMFGSSLTWHGLGANVTFAAIALEGLLVLATPLRRQRQQLVSGLLLGVLLTAVIGLGYVGGATVLVHVPLAVTSFGVALWHAAVANGLRLRRV